VAMVNHTSSHETVEVINECPDTDYGPQEVIHPLIFIQNSYYQKGAKNISLKMNHLNKFI
jgi:hypothetical protein